MDGYQFEEQCAIILKRKHFSKIEITKSSGDQGVDIIAFKHRKKYGIQCKYYTYPVGNKAVQEAYAGANFYDCDKVIVMTNTTFTALQSNLLKNWMSNYGRIARSHLFTVYCSRSWDY